MVYHRLRGVTWLVSTLLTVCLALPATTQQANKSDADLIQEGPLALAAAHNEKPQIPPNLVVTP